MMLALLLLAVINASMFSVQGANKQFISTILKDHVFYYRNDFVSIEIIGEDENSIIYMNIDREIHEASYIMLKPKLLLNGNVMLASSSNDNSLCAHLRKEIYEPNSLEARYLLSQAFNLDGFECPIPKVSDKSLNSLQQKISCFPEDGSVKLMPYMLKKRHTFDDNFPCGLYDYEVHLEQCRPNSNCASLMTMHLKVELTSDNCNW